MTSELVRIEKVTARVAVVHMRREHKRNAMNAALIQALADAAEQVRDDAAIKAVVLTGGRQMFSAGADLQTFQDIGQADIHSVRRMNQAGVRMVDLWESVPALTIAAVEGGAVGGGLALAMACDWRVFAQDAYAYVPEVHLGLNYGWGALPRMTALAGPARAKWMAVLGRRHGAQDLADWRLAEQVAPPGQAMDAALALAHEVAGLPALATQVIKQTVNACSASSDRAASHAEMDHMLLCLSDGEGQAARQAFSQRIGHRRSTH